MALITYFPEWSINNVIKTFIYERYKRQATELRWYYRGELIPVTDLEVRIYDGHEPA